MNTDHKVLACVDQSPIAQHVADAAAWAAKRLGAPMELLHVLERHPELGPVTDHSGAIGANAQEHLLQQLSADDAARTRAARETGRQFLNGLRERALTAGAPMVDTRQRHGDLAETLTEQQDGIRLFVLGSRGSSTGNAHRDKSTRIGGHVEWVVRSVDRPVLVVPEHFRAPTSVLFAFDGSSLSRRSATMMAGSPLLKGLTIHVLMSGKTDSQGPKLLEEARKTLEAGGLSTTAAIETGEPREVISQAVRTHGFDCLVMGTYSHSPWRALFVGSRTSDLLKASAIPTLLLR